MVIINLLLTNLQFMKKYRVNAIFKDPKTTHAAIDGIETIGIKSGDISVIASSDSRNSLIVEQNNKAPEGALAGAVGGGLIGAIAAGLAAAGAIAIPGLNLVIFGSAIPMAATAGASALVGGLSGGLIGLGIPEFEVKEYEEGIKGGSVLVSVQTDDEQIRNKIKSIFENYGAVKIS